MATRVGAVVVHDDASFDGTAETARQWAGRHLDVPVTVVEGGTSVGSSANLLAAFGWATSRGLRIAVTVAADGSSTPELVANVLRPLVHGAADVVLAPVGRRPPAAPPVAVRRIMTTRWNRSTGLHLVDWFSTVRGYRLDRLGVDRLAHLADHPHLEVALVRLAAARRLRVVQPQLTRRRRAAERSTTRG